MARKKARIDGVAAGTLSANEGHMAENEEDTVPAAETVAAAEDAGPAVMENSVIPPVEDIQAEPLVVSVVGSVEETVDESTVDPVAGIVEAALTDDFEVLAELRTEGLREADSLAANYTGNFLIFTKEAANYSKDCFKTRAAFAEALRSAKSLESAVQFQNSYAKAAYARLMAHLIKMNGLYWNLLGEASRPIERAIAKADRAKA